MNVKTGIFLLIIISIFGCKNNSSNNEGIKSGWKINRDLKFHLCYFPDSTEMTGNKVPMIDFGNGIKPDITNINLKGLLALGFPVKKMKKPENFQFYLKFFKYPPRLDQTRSFIGIAQRYKLNFLENYQSLKDFISSRENVVIKMGVIGTKNEFSENNPYPHLKDPGKKNQQDFDNKIPFSSIYVTPKKNKFSKNSSKIELAGISNNGVQNFHKEIHQIYASKLLSIGETKSEYIFYEKLQSQKPGKLINVIRLPKQIMELEKNFKDLPMPQNPDKIFLTGLLLIHSTIYKFEENQNIDEFKSMTEIINKGKPIDSRILEIGSVVDFTKHQ